MNLKDRNDLINKLIEDYRKELIKMTVAELKSHVKTLELAKISNSPKEIQIYLPEQN